MKFTELPPTPRTRPPTAQWAQIVNELKNNPLQYGLVGNFSLGVGSHIRMGRYGSMIPDGISDPDERAEYMKAHWVVSTRRTAPDRADVYIKWIGEGCTCGKPCR